MRIAILLLSFVAMSFATSAQTVCGLYNPSDSAKYVASGVWKWPVPELKDAAKGSYFKILDYMNDKATPYDSTTFNNILYRYEYWREVVDLKLSNKKDRDDFHNWLVAEARTAGKTL